MDTKDAEESKALRKAYGIVETCLIENGFTWESRFAKKGYSADTYVMRPLVVKICWEHKTDK